MKFLKKQDINRVLNSCLLEDLTNGDERLLDVAEVYSIRICESYMRHQFDYDFELRPYVLDSEIDTSLILNDIDNGTRVLHDNTSGTSGLDFEEIYVYGTNGTYVLPQGTSGTSFDTFVQMDIKNDDRNPILIDIVLSIAIYDLLRSVSSSDISASIQDRYNEALDMLDKINRGRIDIGIRDNYIANTETGILENHNHEGIIFGKTDNNKNKF